MIADERAIWLQERTELGILSESALTAISEALEPQTIPANQHLALENTPPLALYILQAGKLRSDASFGESSSLLPGSVVHLQEFLLHQSSRYTVTTLSECQFWTISAPEFQAIIDRFPEISQAFSTQLATQLAAVSTQLAYERERQEELRPYLVTKAKRGIIGSSRYAKRLRQQVRDAAEDRRPVLVFGEPGLEKDNIAALIHYGSQWRREPIIQLTSGLLQTSGAELFGRTGGKPGLIEWVGTGTIVLNNIQDLPSKLCPQIARLLETGTYTPVDRSGETSVESRTCQAQIIMISEKALPKFDRFIPHQIKVPPIRVRKADIKAQVDYYLSLACRARGIPKPTVTPEALRRLQAYDFPNNLRELESLVRRAVSQIAGASVLTEELFWSVPTKKVTLRYNLLKRYPQFRQFLRSSWYPDRINYGLTTWFFALVVLILFIGPQTRDRNFALNLFWAWWWPLILLGFPFIGRLWCAVCPFMIYGEIAQKVSLKLFPRQLQRWPRESAQKWGGWFLFGLFALIFLWEELWDLENTAYLSSCLLLLITAGAVIFSVLFERRFWCRYLCPIGGMNGLFAKLSMTELRAQQGICAAECTTYQCYKGGPRKGEGLETDGCPLYSHPAQLEDNRDCVLCMTCLKACPHRSVEFNLRPPGIELWTTHVPHAYEVALLFLLLGGVFLHRLPEIQSFLGWNVNLDRFFTHFLVSISALVLPAIVPFLSYGFIHLISKLGKTSKPRSFVELAYGYLPLVLGLNIAHYLQLGLGEAGRILPVTAATFGWNGTSLPIWVADPAVISFLQGTAILISVIFTVFLTQKIARQSIKLMLPQHLGTIAIALFFWQTIAPNSL
ncbi:MAG TPA: sigma 54-interacting transcriptional regulator [Oscillatoriales cyanobacterium M59_W2019_021]|nr:MAG: 4Fe-4S binding protein [Cyanobacteria bacterium J055]HIK31248.1 sigma 54-interacting transcriptional regulator [Oscillatoriales cyanobacterium M4454_W2019_049]HIK51045.1 sigma 54-interacting transcriptional regulator [Oscillatoriales cyanobacterium M59_W2019_021]